MQPNPTDSPDRRIDQILTSLAAGKRREQIAEELSYKSYKSLDLFMKRNKYTWDQKRNYYFPSTDHNSSKKTFEFPFLHKPDSRTASILSLLNQGKDLKEIADQLRFTDHRELALYMKNRGYIWSEKDRTYHFNGHSNNYPISQESQQNQVELEQTNEKTLTSDSLINYLEQNKNVIYQLISSHTHGVQLPRYMIPGVYITKSMSMNYGMDMLVRSYSQENNVSQKDIVEIALVDFFCKYGFLKEVNTLLGRK
jgi:hypothetical protein